MASSIYRFKGLDFLFKKIVKTNITPQRQDLINTIRSIDDYTKKTLKWNQRREIYFDQLSSRHRKIGERLGYLERISKVKEAIKVNGVIIDDIVKSAINKYQIEPSELRLGISTIQNFRVIESLCHYQRDWSVVGEEEIEPILKFFRRSLMSLMKKKKINENNSIIIIPGSGLGRIAHEIALMGFQEVHAVEYSLLMNLFNEFVYSDFNNQNYTIYPYIHSYSHHINEENQLRTIKLNGKRQIPKNLYLHNADFRNFSLPNVDENVKNIILVTEFFIDTAENVFEYVDAINNLTENKNGYWINLGPLKYGSAPKIEPNLNEWKLIKKEYGWHDIVDVNPLNDELIGYLTDKKSLWQGNYGVARWVSEKI